MSTPVDLIAKPAHQEAILRREFDAPPDLLYDVFTDARRIPEWWAADRDRPVVERMEVRPGGRWRFVLTGPDGQQHGFHGVYHDAVRAQWVVQTFEDESAPGKVLMETTTFNDRGGSTLLVQRSVFQTPEDRDELMAAGMEDAAKERLERLAALVENGRRGGR